MSLQVCLAVFSIFTLADSFPTKTLADRSEHGYPMGYLSECPGADKSVSLHKDTLRRHSITLQLEGSTITAKKIVHTYFQMKQLAEKLDFSKKTVMFVGGYLDSPLYFMSVGSIMGSAYSAKGYNVLMVDNNPFTTAHYPVAVRQMFAVAHHTAEMLVNLTHYGLDPKKLELIGLSLGAHTMGFIGKGFYQLTGVKIGRLTGLDPSGPCFRHVGPEHRLDASDGDFVDVIHTNIDGLGMAAPIGHVNYYVNGGELQPGELYFWMLCFNACSHFRSYVIWWFALHQPPCFKAIQCDSIQQARDRKCYDRQPRVISTVGLDVDQTKHGIFYLATSNMPPYCMGSKGLKSENDFYSTRMKAFNFHDHIIL